MAEPRVANAFQMLDDDGALESTNSSDSDDVNDSENNIIKVDTTQPEPDNNQWTDVLSTKSRRLAPQCTISMQDSETRKSRAVVLEKDQPKKKGIVKLVFFDILKVA